MRAQGGHSAEGHFTLSKKRTRFFHNKRILTDFWWILIENKRIFAQGVRDFLGVKCPSHSADTHTGDQSKKFAGNPKISLQLHCNPKISAHLILRNLYMSIEYP